MLAAGTMAVGYAFIFSGIATPPGGDLGVVQVPDPGEATAVLLDDGRPVFVVRDAGARPWVFDAEAPAGRGRLRSLVAWCPTNQTFSDPLSGSVYAADGRLIDGSGTTGLLEYAKRSEVVDHPTSFIVQPETQARGVRRDGVKPALTCPEDGWITHRPEGGETFDPSVAADQEPPGWTWLEGSLQVVDGEVRLCDGLDGACHRSASVVGIDPASVASGDRFSVGLYFGRVHDGDIEGLAWVPIYEEGS